MFLRPVETRNDEMKIAIVLWIAITAMGGADIVMNSMVHVYSTIVIIVFLGSAYLDLMTFTFLWKKRRYILHFLNKILYIE